ncbi:MAG: DUF29 family protein [Acetobacteraceae bacterium]|jgi:hypothetical protein
MSDLYDEDIVLWSERQGELLRRRAAGELVNEAELDWPNLAEQIESVGNEQRFVVESLLVQAIVQLLKAHVWPDCRDAPNWRALTQCRSVAMRRHDSFRRCDSGLILRESGAGRCWPCPIRSMARRWCRCLRRVHTRLMNLVGEEALVGPPT